MRVHLLISVFLFLLLGFMLVLASQNGCWELLHLALCMCTAITILFVSRARAEYLWLGALGGVALVLTPLTPALTGRPFWPDAICVAVFVGYYKLFIACQGKPGSGGHEGGYRHVSSH